MRSKNSSIPWHQNSGTSSVPETHQELVTGPACLRKLWQKGRRGETLGSPGRAQVDICLLASLLCHSIGDFLQRTPGGKHKCKCLSCTQAPHDFDLCALLHDTLAFCHLPAFKELKMQHIKDGKPNSPMTTHGWPHKPGLRLQPVEDYT